MYFTITHPMHSHPYNPELVSGEGIATVAAAAEAAGIHGFGFGNCIHRSGLGELAASLAV